MLTWPPAARVAVTWPSWDARDRTRRLSARPTPKIVVVAATSDDARRRPTSDDCGPRADDKKRREWTVPPAVARPKPPYPTFWSSSSLECPPEESPLLVVTRRHLSSLVTAATTRRPTSNGAKVGKAADDGFVSRLVGHANDAGRLLEVGISTSRLQVASLRVASRQSKESGRLDDNLSEEVSCCAKKRPKIVDKANSRLAGGVHQDPRANEPPEPRESPRRRVADLSFRSRAASSADRRWRPTDGSERAVCC